jgi:NAD(P)-dependent dehydrogenase (short-subunit alcohol dehydrogenase family)
VLLEGKIAILYGAAGAIGSHVARAFARSGARVMLTARHEEPLQSLAAEINKAGGAAELAVVDALDAEAVETHAGSVANRYGAIDISLNVVAIPHDHGMALIDMAVRNFADPIRDYAATHFITATAAARRMVKQGTGVILTVVAPPGRTVSTLSGPFGTVCAAIEGFTRNLAAEIGPHNVRAVCLLSSGSPEAPAVHRAIEQHAGASNISFDQFRHQLEAAAALHRMTTLDELANIATLVASEFASAMTATTADVSCGGASD